jgi:hypothetical protein
MLISEVEKTSFLLPLVWRTLCPLFYRVEWRPRGVPKTLKRCLRGEDAMGAVEVAVATCICECRPSLGCRGDVGDGTVKDPRSLWRTCDPCGRCTGVVPLLTDGARGLVGTWLRGVDEERIIPSPRKPGRGGCRLVSRGGVNDRTVLNVAWIVAAFLPPSRDRQ